MMDSASSVGLRLVDSVTKTAPSYYHVYGHSQAQKSGAIGGGDHNQEGLQFPSCTNLTVQQLKNLNLAVSISGLICLVILILILVLLIWYKAYQRMSQRLFIYFTVMSILLEASWAIQIEHQFHYHGQDTVCKLLGFFVWFTVTMTLTFSIEISICLLYMVYKQLKGETLPQSKCLNRTMECVLVLISILLPLTYLWIPFLSTTATYGLSDAGYCAMKLRDQVTCKVLDPRDVLLVQVSAAGLCIVVIVAVLIFAVMMISVYRVKRRDVNSRLVIRQWLLLSVFIVCFYSVLAAWLIAVLFLTKYDTYVESLLFQNPCPFLLLLPIVFLIYFFIMRNKLVPSRTTSSIGKVKNSEPSERQLTNPTSHPARVPSDTHFSVEYTGAFTSVTDNQSTPLLSSQTTCNRYNAVTES